MYKLCDGAFDKSVSCVAVIMAGGFGTRFWPLSRQVKPKQFLALGGDDRSLIRQTADRLSGLVEEQGVLVVTGTSLVQLTRQHLPKSVVMAEPIGRNTAPCIGLAAIKILHDVGDVPMVCLPSDHVVVGEEHLRAIYADGVKIAAEEDVIVLVGMKPCRPDTGLGYIQRGQQAQTPLGQSRVVYKVRAFKEKPNQTTAEQYLASGEYYWNGGMFIMRPSVILAEMEKLMPELYQGLKEIEKLLDVKNSDEQIAEIFKRLPAISIDFGVMEKATNVLVIPGESFVWNDVGSWTAWAEQMELRGFVKDSNISRGDTCFVDSKNCAVYSEKSFVGVVGLENVVVVDTGDALLVCHRDKTQDVREVVEFLKANSRSELL